MNVLTATTSEVAKFGGSSMARPEIVTAQLEYESDRVPVIVCSAPGIDREHGFDKKVTQVLLDNSFSMQSEIEERFKHIACLYDPAGTDYAVHNVVRRINEDIDHWNAHDWPLAGLGEYWSAQMLAAHTGREFVDAREIIRFDTNGSLDESTTLDQIKLRLLPGRKYVVPGFYGADRSGNVHLLDRGGSDVTGALIAKALEADEYHNWSDVPGYMSADPQIVPNATPLSNITYHEARDLGVGGSQLLHRSVSKILCGTNTTTVMRQTAGELGNRGTHITGERINLATEPIAGITGSLALSLSVHRFGLNEEVGGEREILEAFEKESVSFEQTGSGFDTITVYTPIPDPSIDSVSADIYHETAQKLSNIAKNLQNGETPVIEFSGLLHIVGEGMRISGQTRTNVKSKVMQEFERRHIAIEGETASKQSPTSTIFIEILDKQYPASELEYSIQSTHDALAHMFVN